MSAEKRSISAPAELFRQADARKQQLGYSTFSDYIQALMRADAIEAGPHMRETYVPPEPIKSESPLKKPTLAANQSTSSAPGASPLGAVVSERVGAIKSGDSNKPAPAPSVKYPPAIRSKKKPRP